MIFLILENIPYLGFSPHFFSVEGYVFFRFFKFPLTAKYWHVNIRQITPRNPDYYYVALDSIGGTSILSITELLKQRREPVFL
jgi:hypothetical protein